MAKLIMSLDRRGDQGGSARQGTRHYRPQAHNDIQIDNLAVSGEHALIVTILNDSFLEDLGSTNGTLVNGNPVKKHILQNNDVIEIGKYKLKYVSEAPRRRRPPSPISRKPWCCARRWRRQARARRRPAARRRLRRYPGARPAPAPQPTPQSQPPPPVSAADRAKQPDKLLAAIQILTGPSAGKELELVKNLTTLGKPGVQVAVITRRPQGYFITHVEGANFPVVNGKALDAQAHQLNDHDVVELAGVKMEFFFKND